MSRRRSSSSSSALWLALVYLGLLVLFPISSVHAATLSIAGGANAITSDGPIIVNFTGSETTSTFVWRVAIVKKDEELIRSNICNTCWKRVCGSQTCKEKPANGFVLFNPEDIGGPGEYKAYLTGHAFKKREGPVSFTITATSPSPPPGRPSTLPTPVPSVTPNASSPSFVACDPNKANNCIEAKFIDASKQIIVPFVNSPSEAWKIAIVRAGEDPKSQNIISCSGDKLAKTLGSKNGVKNFDMKACDDDIYEVDVYMTTKYYFKTVGPVRIKVSEESSTSPTSAPCIEEDEIRRIIDNGGTPASLSTTAFSTQSSAMTTSSNTKYDDYGCFYHDAEKDKNTFISAQIFKEGDSHNDKADKCDTFCDTRHFAITKSKCFCYVKAPTRRLTIQGCSSVVGSCLDEDKLMDAFLNGVSSKECNQDNTSAVRNFLVEEDDAPFGYDITANSFRLSPFELEKDECGTNIYEVQTEVSEGTNILSTNSKVVSEFATERRLHISGSVSVGASVSAWIPFIVNGGAEVMASMDSEVNSIMKYSGASTIASKVFTSFGVKRIAEVKLVDFDNRFNFVTFNSQFANLLRKYRDGGFSLEVAKEIFEKYGMFVVERGIFGGYRQLRSTVDSQEIENYSSSENDFKLCYELAMSVNAKKLFGLIKKEASTEIAGCTAEVQKQMNRGQERFSQEVSNEVVGGGKIIDLDLGGGKSFVVSPNDSILLTDVDHYPEGDDGIKLRILSDFLLPDKVSPLEAKRHLITEQQFEEIRSNLDAHIVEVLQNQLESLGKCPQSSECTVPYLEENNGSTTTTPYQCSCYTPKEPEPLDICSKDGLFQPDENKFYTIQRNNKDGDYWKEQDSFVLLAPDAKNDSRAHWKFKKTGVSNNWFVTNGHSGKHVSSLDSDHRLMIGSSRREVKVICQDDGTISISDASTSQSRYGTTVLTKSKSSECRYPTFLKSCEDYFGITFEKRTDYKKCGSLDLKRYKVCSQFSITFPLRGTFKKTTKCGFPNFLGSCSDNFGSGWVQEGTQKCGLIKRRKKCKFTTTDKSSSFFANPVAN